MLAVLLIAPWPIIALSQKSSVSPNIVAVPANGPSLSAAVSPVFSRSAYFVLIDLKTNEVKAIPNPYRNEQHTVGLRCADLLAENEAGVVIAKQAIGPEPYTQLTSRGVQVFVGNPQTVANAVDQYKRGLLRRADAATVKTHHGLQELGAATGPAAPCPFADPTLCPQPQPGMPTPNVPPNGQLGATPLHPGGQPPGIDGPLGPWAQPNAGLAFSPANPAAASLMGRPTKGPIQIPELGMEVVGYDPGGVAVHRVYRGSWAEQGGLQRHDFILTFNGKKAVDLTRVVHLVSTAPPEKVAALKIVRNGRTLTKSVMVGEGELEAVTVPRDAAPPYSRTQSPTPAPAGAPMGQSPATGATQFAASAPTTGPVSQVPEIGIEVASFDSGGVVVKRVYPGSWGQRGKLKAGDLIIKFARRNVTDATCFFRLVNRATPERPVEVRIIRDGKVMTRSVVVGEGELEAATVPPDAAPPYSQALPAGAAPKALWNGMAAPPITAGQAPPTLIRRLGMEVVSTRAGGAKVSGVMGNSRAQVAGVRAGDVVLRCGATRIRSAAQLQQLLSQTPPQTDLRVEVLRSGRTKTLSIMVGTGRMQGVTPIAPR